jgi:hypothetical protein
MSEDPNERRYQSVACQWENVKRPFPAPRSGRSGTSKVEPFARPIVNTDAVIADVSR